jgi:Poly(3-hydroxybutyrate) depolymerase
MSAARPVPRLLCACCLAAIALLASIRSPLAGEPLPPLSIDTAQVSVSGVSSGGYMATQMLVAHSARIIGAGIIAAGPWFCAGTDFPWNAVTVFARCMNLPDLIPFLGPPDIDSMVIETRHQAAVGGIDDPSNLGRAHVYLFSGAEDTLMPRPVVDALRDYYEAFIPASHVRFEGDIEAAHAMVTADFGQPCDTFATPFINDCRYDAAGNLLQQIYGRLSPPVAPTGTLRAFDQRAFFGNDSRAGMAAEGYVYIPAGCAGGGCRLHVAFHGCAQNAAAIGDAFYRHAGYNRWAEANRIVVLYPQTAAITRSVLGFTLPWPNPQACWDWWGFTADDYYTKAAPQIRAITAMIDRLASRP